MPRYRYVITYVYSHICIYIYIYIPAPPNYPLRDPKYHLIETIRPLMEVHWGVLVYNIVYIFPQQSAKACLTSLRRGPVWRLRQLRPAHHRQLRSQRRAEVGRLHLVYSRGLGSLRSQRPMFLRKLPHRKPQICLNMTFANF